MTGEWENGMKRMKQEKFISFSMIEIRVFILRELFLNKIWQIKFFHVKITGNFNERKEVIWDVQ